MDKYFVLKQYFGHEEFRRGQEQLIDCIISGGDVLCVMPTGAGKSMCYQVPALLLPGITLVISPLISLMKDQVNALTQSGVRAAYINSSLTAAQYNRVLDNMSHGLYKIIYVAPERLSVESFRNTVDNLSVSFVAVDEAHCVSQWGQDFRPSYLKIKDFIDEMPERPVIGAFTATATKAVKDDICRLLNLHDPLSVTTGFDRPNLYFAVRTPENKDSELTKIVRERAGKSGVVYCSTRKAVEEVCDLLKSNGISATRYHAGLSDNERYANQEAFVYDRAPVMVATNAFGMGIDKSNVAYVIHYNMPKNIESYYQEAGRAGRDGMPAECILLYSPRDIFINKFLINNSEPNPELDEEAQAAIREKDLERLKYMSIYCTTPDCLRRYMLGYFGEQLASDCGNCSVCDSDNKMTDVTVDAQKILSCVARSGQRYGAAMITDVLKGSKSAKIANYGLDRLSTYGIMADSTTDRIRRMINALVADGALIICGSEYPTLALGDNADGILRRGVRFEAKLPEMKVKAKQKSSGQAVGYDEKLFAELKALRLKLADKASVPAYVIFTDSSLRDMCAKKPDTRAKFLDISGVGEMKLERYGDAFIAAIKAYKEREADE